MVSVLVVTIGCNLLDVVSLSDNGSSSDLDSFGGLIIPNGGFLIVVFLSVDIILFFEEVFLGLETALLIKVFVVFINVFFLAVVHYGDRLCGGGGRLLFFGRAFWLGWEYDGCISRIARKNQTAPSWDTTLQVAPIW